MPLPDKVMDLASAMAAVRPGTRLMMGEFVGAGEPARCVQWLLDAGIGELTLIANTPGMRGGFGKAKLFESGQIREYIGTHVGTTAESTEAYLAGRVKLREFFPMGTWAEKVRAGAMGLGGVLVPFEGFGVNQEDSREYFVEAALTAEVAIIKGWRADRFGNVEFRGVAGQNQRDIAMAGRYTIAEVNEIVEVGAIEPQRVGCPGVFVDAVVQGHALEVQHDLYRRHWLELGRLAPAA